MSSNTLKEFTRFAIVGLASNLVLYCVYLVLTEYFLHYFLAMTLAYLMGVCQTFFFNKKWTFEYDGHVQKSFIRYCLVYLFGYFFSAISLYIFVEVVGAPHYIVQAVTILVLAVFIFVLQKFWVFAGE